MSKSHFTVFDLLDVSQSERQIILYLSRTGSADSQSLAGALDMQPAEVEEALGKLLRQERIRQTSDGRYEMPLGIGRRRRTLPARLWPALLTTDRLYAEQEIATLRTAIPLLQFARARLSEFTDHGPGHALRVKSFATQISYILNLTQTERHLLRAGALFHDIGNVVDRETHNVVSQETVEKLAAQGKLPFTAEEAHLIGLLCRWHRREYEPERTDTLRDTPIRTGLLAAVLRVADAMDIDHRRSDHSAKFRGIVEFFFPDSVPHWTGADDIMGVRIRCDPNVELQVFARGDTANNLQATMLREDLESTPLEWSVVQVNVAQDGPPPAGDREAGRHAVVVFPFEAHSIVMAALSRKHLAEAGYTVGILCYPDTADGPRWLWREALPEVETEGLKRVVVIGDRPDPSMAQHVHDTVEQWEQSGIDISVLNRHEGNWLHVPDLVTRAAEVILGGDWAYFWGNSVSENDLIWGRIAALCTRDPTQSTVGVTNQEKAITQGLLNVVYGAITSHQSASDTADWLELAEPILERIADDDRGYFIQQARGFIAAYTQAALSPRTEGQVLIFDQAPGPVPQAYYWIMEAEIERHGRMPERGIRYHYPYVIATWPEGDVVELLAISHWREEEAIPIRMLYPADLGPPAQGNESTIRARMSPEQAAAVVPALVAACNRSPT
ncbi:MAG: HD domain-containing protein [Anaerolineae bacterium]|nr:HD domain-containing protein [Anaerolineae bacterium]